MRSKEMYYWAFRLGCTIMLLACMSAGGMALEDETVSRKATEDVDVKATHVKKAVEKGMKVRQGAREALTKGQQAIRTGARKVQQSGKKVLEDGKAAVQAAGTKAKAVGEKMKSAGTKVKDRGKQILDEAGRRLKNRGERPVSPEGGIRSDLDGPAVVPKTPKP